MRILHVDDHPLFCSGLTAVVNNLLPGFEIKSALDIEQANIFLHEMDVDLILLDLDMPGVNGLAFMRSLIQRELNIPVAILSAHEDVKDIKQALTLGAVGFLPKAWSPEKLVQALEMIERGDVVIPEYVQQKLASPSWFDASIAEQDVLSQRQVEVLRLLDQGLSNKEIAKSLVIGENTVKTHLKAIFQLLSCKNRIDCLNKARELNLV